MSRVRAQVSATMCVLPASRSACAQAMSVAPVVWTSSMSSTRAGASSRAVTRMSSLPASRRCAREAPSCRGAVPLRCSARASWQAAAASQRAGDELGRIEAAAAAAAGVRRDGDDDGRRRRGEGRPGEAAAPTQPGGAAAPSNPRSGGADPARRSGGADPARRSGGAEQPRRGVGGDLHGHDIRQRPGGEELQRLHGVTRDAFVRDRRPRRIERRVARRDIGGRTGVAARSAGSTAAAATAALAGNPRRALPPRARPGHGRRRSAAERRGRRARPACSPMVSPKDVTADARIATILRRNSAVTCVTGGRTHPARASPEGLAENVRYVVVFGQTPVRQRHERGTRAVRRPRLATAGPARRQPVDSRWSPAAGRTGTRRTGAGVPQSRASSNRC